MRRATTLIVAICLTVTVLSAWSAASGGMKTVRYDGYTIEVPANWPVYRLAQDPAQCVRYDQHAVYLGTPGADQVCPAHLVGHVATVSLEPSAPAQAPVAGPLWHVAAPAMGAARGLWQAGGVLLQNQQNQAFRAILHNPALTVDATYAGSPGLAAQIIGSIRRTAAGPAAAGATAAGSAAGTTAAGSAAGATAAGTAAGTAGATSAATAAVAAPGAGSVVTTSAVARASRAETAAAVRRTRRHRTRRHHARRHHSHHHARRHHTRRRHPRRKPHHGVQAGTIKGFDACTAPSLRVMRAWRPYFGAVNIYIGGPEVACGYGNLSPAWIASATAMGWALIPTYVGRQAPCTTFQDRITVGRARAQGEQAARDAINLASSLGLRQGAPLYDDMEYYNPRDGVCRRQVLSFLNGWTRELHARGYRSGVYSSASAGAHDLGATSVIYGQKLAKPDSIWFALWNGKADLQGTPYLQPGWWPHARIKQFEGAHRLRLAGATLNIDSDLIGGAVYR